MKEKKDILKIRRKQVTMALISVAIVACIASIISDYNVLQGIVAVPKALIWAVKNFYPDQKSLSKLPMILRKTKETILLAIAATTVAGILAFAFSLMGSKVTNPNKIVSKIPRVIASIFRNIPDTVWAMILLFSFGQNVMTGYFALFFTTFGMLTRAFIEAIDEASQSSLEALRATGATYFQTITQSIIPSSMPQIISWVFFMIDTNIRSSTLIGLLTGTGIGYEFSMYYKSMNYNAASLVVIFIVLSVLLIETISNKVRRVIL